MPLERWQLDQIEARRVAAERKALGIVKTYKTQAIIAQFVSGSTRFVAIETRVNGTATAWRVESYQGGRPGERRTCGSAAQATRLVKTLMAAFYAARANRRQSLESIPARRQATRYWRSHRPDPTTGPNS